VMTPKRYFQNLRRMKMDYKKGYMPVEGEKDLRCNFLGCSAGCGLAGNGCCYLNGHWWMEKCPEFKKEDEDGKTKSNIYITNNTRKMGTCHYKQCP
jgi:hypothetical protein